MRVVAMCCTLNEERNIERYCEVYSRFTDAIVICDGGSTDRTVKLAQKFSKVNVVHFDELLSFEGFPWNPKGKQHNFAYAAVMESAPDWIITDECDSVPTVSLQKQIRPIMRATSIPVIGAMRVYVLGENFYFPKMSLGGFFGWAHRPGKVNASYGEETHRGLRRKNFPPADTWTNLNPPHALLHYGWPDEETVRFKTKRYRAVGNLPPSGRAIPPYAGVAADLPRWAKWN